MSADVHEFPKRVVKTRGGGGDGPLEPTLVQRVAALERKIDRIEAKLERHDDAFRRIEEALKALADDNREFRRQLADLTAKVANVEGRILGIDGRLSQIPTTWQIVAILATLLIGIAGLIFTASRVLHP